jgi:hypothetical protein
MFSAPVELIYGLSGFGSSDKPCSFSHRLALSERIRVSADEARIESEVARLELEQHWQKHAKK